MLSQIINLWGSDEIKNEVANGEIDSFQHYGTECGEQGKYDGSHKVRLICLIFLLQETIDKLTSQLKAFQEKMKRVEESILSRDYKKHIQVTLHCMEHLDLFI